MHFPATTASTKRPRHWPTTCSSARAWVLWRGRESQLPPRTRHPTADEPDSGRGVRSPGSSWHPGRSAVPRARAHASRHAARGLRSVRTEVEHQPGFHAGNGARPAGLPAADEHPEFAFAQDYLHSARTDLKVFGIGDEVFGVRKTFGADSFLHTGEPAAPSPEVESIVRRVAGAFGLELFGVDVAEDERGAYVFDVNSFPGFRGVPDAPGRLAAYIERRARDHA